MEVAARTPLLPHSHTPLLHAGCRTPPPLLPASSRPQTPTGAAGAAAPPDPAVRNSSPASPAASGDAAAPRAPGSEEGPACLAGGQRSAPPASPAPTALPAPAPMGCRPADGIS